MSKRAVHARAKNHDAHARGHTLNFFCDAVRTIASTFCSHAFDAIVVVRLLWLSATKHMP
jgi:hypothetical protein